MSSLVGLLRRARVRLAYLGYLACWRLVRWAPEPLVAAVFRFGADVAYRRNGKKVRRLRSNLRRVIGPASPSRLEAVVRGAMRSYSRYWMEFFRLPEMPVRRIASGMHIVGFEQVEQVMATGKGVVVALPHTGNWDHAGAWLAQVAKVPFATVAERLEPVRLFDRFVAVRERLGMEVLPLTGGERPPFGVLAARLRAGGAVMLVADRDLSTHGVEVKFFDGVTRMPAGPATLALRTGAVLFAATLWYDGPDWGVKVHPPVPVPESGTQAERVAWMTQQLADVFAAGIAEHPTDWHMLQRLWLDDLDPDDPRRGRQGMD